MSSGHITVAIGPMLSGKSAWLIEELENKQKAERKILAISYAKDNRYATNSIASKNGKTFAAQTAVTINDIKHILQQTENIDVFAIDEIQFFEKDLTDMLVRLKTNDITVFAAGLDLDFLANPWETTNEVLHIADTVKLFTAICTICKKPTAIKTQRLINGKPAPKDSPRIVIGDTDMYEPRCGEHYEGA